MIADTSASLVNSNYHFNHPDRAPYELGYLLKQLSPAFSASVDPTSEDVLIAEAAISHAGIAAQSILSGLEALGTVIAVAAESKESTIDPGVLCQLGYLVKHLAVEAQFAAQIKEHLDDARTQQVRRAEAQRGTGGAHA